MRTKLELHIDLTRTRGIDGLHVHVDQTRTGSLYGLTPNWARVMDKNGIDFDF